MKTELQNQYLAIKETIRSNIETIRRLVQQADSLRIIVDKMSESKDNSVKEELSEEIKNINKSIEALIANTEELFKLYSAFVDTVVGK